MNPKQQSFLSILLLVSAFTLARAEVTSNIDSLEFIGVPVGKSLKQHAILGNNGNTRIDIQSVEIIGDDAEFFSTTYTEKLPRFIYPGNTPWMAVFFSPTEPGLFSAELILNLSDGTQLIYPLEGGTTDNNLGVVLNVAAFDFGLVEIGEREKLYGIFENLGTLRTDIVAASITGSDADLFSSSYVDKLPRFIYPGSTPWMPVYYEPTRAGSHSATLTLVLSDGDPIVLPLSGGEDQPVDGPLAATPGVITQTSAEITWNTPTSSISGYRIELTPTEPVAYVGIGSSNDLVHNFDQQGDLPAGALTTLDLKKLGKVAAFLGINSDGVPVQNTVQSQNPGGLTLIGESASVVPASAAGDTFGLTGLAFDENDELYGIASTDGFQCFIEDADCTSEELSARLVKIDIETASTDIAGRIRDDEGNFFEIVHDLTFVPETGFLYAAANCDGLACAIEIDKTGLVTRELPSTIFDAVSIATTSDGNLWLGGNFGPIGCLRCPPDLETRRISDNTKIDSELIQFEQQFISRRNVIRSALVVAATTTPDGRLVGTSNNDNTAVYLRIPDASPMLPTGELDPDRPGPVPAWRNLGDTGNNVEGIALTNIEPGGPSTIIMDIPIGTNNVSFDNLKPMARYEGRLIALDANGNESEFIEDIVIVTLMPNPNGLAAEEINNIVRMSWEPVDPLLFNQVTLVREYAVYASRTNFSSVENLEPIAVVPFGENTFRTNALDAGTWHFAIVSVNDSGVSDDQVQTISLTIQGGTADNVAPVVTAPADVSAEATGVTTAVTLVSATAIDDQDGELVAVPSPSGPFSVGQTQVTWSATDTAGNTGTSEQTVTITDTTPPSISAPADIELAFDEVIPGNLDIGTASASDLTGNPVITNNAPAQFSFGTNEVIWTATDLSGNTSTDLQTITLENTGTGMGNPCAGRSLTASPDELESRTGWATTILNVQLNDAQACGAVIECPIASINVGSAGNLRPAVAGQDWLLDTYNPFSRNGSILLNGELNPDGSNKIYEVNVRCLSANTNIVTDIITIIPTQSQ